MKQFIKNSLKISFYGIVRSWTYRTNKLLSKWNMFNDHLIFAASNKIEDAANEISSSFGAGIPK